MFKAWRNAKGLERSGLILILVMVGIVFIDGSVTLLGGLEEAGLPYPIWRIGVWLLLLYGYVEVTFRVMGPTENDSRTRYTLYLLLLIGLMCSIVLTVPTNTGWLLAAPLAADIEVFYAFPRSLPLYLLMLAAMIAPYSGFDVTASYFVSRVLSLLPQFTILLFFVTLFAAFQRRERNARQQTERLAAELESANHQLAQYATQVEELAITKERNRLAREIHDNLGHYLTVVNVQLEAGKMLLDKKPEKARESIVKAQKMTQEGLQAIRHSISALRENPAETKPITESIAELVEQNRATGIVTEYKIVGEPRPLNPKTTLTLYRVVQEGLTNIRKHSQAEQVDVIIDYAKNASVRVSLQDDGMGAASAENGFGLLGLRERVGLLDGTIDIQTAPGAGFKITVAVPG